ncbi:MAG: hypothetical protein LAT67_06325 [Balneolales bacterium]|nr:hypothetical protein [Balneolales bacterium]
MKYPIFDSIVNHINNEISKRGIKPDTFRVWTDKVIKATGLEIVLKLKNHKSGIESITINFDWDMFREAKLADRLSGMDKHPLNGKDIFTNTRAIQAIDIETSWNFDEKAVMNNAEGQNPDSRIDYTSNWINALNAEISEKISIDGIINRWHLEIEGDANGKYVSSMCLLMYQQLILDNCRDLADIHKLTELKIQKILSKSLRLLDLASRTRPKAA